MGLHPAATFLTVSEKMARARTVAVVVPSPATSLVLEATSWRRRAPRFSNLSSRTMALETVTPSIARQQLVTYYHFDDGIPFVILGEP
jgi:hypothetical protein